VTPQFVFSAQGAKTHNAFNSSWKITRHRLAIANCLPTWAAQVYNPATLPAAQPARHHRLQTFFLQPEFPMASKKKAVNFEESLKALEALVNQMEKGDLSLEESLQAFEQGVALTRDCQTRLAMAEQQVRKLVENQGEIALEPFDPLENDDQ